MQFSITTLLVAALATVNAQTNPHANQTVTLDTYKNTACSRPPGGSAMNLTYNACIELTQPSKAFVFPDSSHTIPRKCVVNGYSQAKCKGSITAQVGPKPSNDTCLDLPSGVTALSVNFTCTTSSHDVPRMARIDID